MQIDFALDAKLATVQLRVLQRGIREGAIARALNKTATTVRAEAARRIARKLGRIKIGEVRKALRVLRANRQTLLAKVIASGRKRIPLTAFGAVQTRYGVRVRVLGQAYTIAHAFIRERSGGRKAVRIRAPSFRAQLVDHVDFRGRRRGGTELDYPIAEIMAPGVPIVFVQEEIQRTLETVARTRFAIAIEQEVRFELSRLL